MRNAFKIFVILLLHLNAMGQVRTVPSSFNPIYDLPGSGTNIIGGSLLGKEIRISDSNDGSATTIIIYTPSQDTTNFPSALNNLAIGSVMHFNLAEVNDTIYIRSDDGVNGIVGSPGFPFTEPTNFFLRLSATGWVIDDRVFDVNSLSGVKDVNARPGDIIRVNSVHPPAQFYVKSSGTARYNGVAERTLNNGYVARVIPIENKYHVNHFGAIPNDGNSDDFYIQEAINFILSEDPQSSGDADKSQSTLLFGAGVYEIDTGIVMNRTTSIADKTPILAFETITLEGVSNAYGEFNATTLKVMNDSTFAIGTQACRSCAVKNMSIQMNAGLKGNFEKDSMINNDVSTLNSYLSQYVRIDQASPSAAIVIDPFSNASASSKYPLWSSSYNGSYSETSQFTMDGISIAYFHTAIAINPGNIGQNGDNVRLSNSHVESVFRIWYTGSSQSRQNSIDNVYATNFGQLVANGGTGTPPSIRNVNGAGIIRQLFDIDSGFGPLRMDNCYFEGLFALGRMGAVYNVFNQCQFKFNQNVDEPVAGLVGWGRDIINFNDCAIQFFSNALNPVPLHFESDHITFNRCHLETGIIINSSVPDGQYVKVRINDSEFYAPFNSSGDDVQFRYSEPTSSDSYVHNRFVASGEYRASSGGWQYGGQLGYPFKLVSTEVVSITKDTLDVSGNDTLVYKFTSSNVGRYKLYDNIMCSYDFTNILGEGSADMMLGRIIRITGNDVYVGYIPAGGPNSMTETVYNILPRYFTYPFWGNITSGNDTIKNAYGKVPTAGLRYYNSDYFPDGTYIETVVNDSTYVMSTNATSTGSDIAFYDVFSGSENSRSSPGSGYVLTGSKWYKNGTDDIDYLRCTQGGIFGDANHPPQWADTAWYNRGPYQNDTVVVSTVKTADDSDYNVGNDFLANINLQEINVWATCASGAGSNTQILLPATSSFYLGKKVRIIAADASGTYDVQISASTNELWQAGSTGTSLTLADGDTYTLICMEDADNPGSYLWAIQN